MTEIFRTRQEPPQEPEIALQAPSTQKSDELAGYEEKAQEELSEQESDLEIWEGLNRTKFINDFFDVRAYEGEFNLKMQTATIDKYIKSELEKRGYQKNTENWKKIMSEIESEIGSDRMEKFKRINRITNYIKVLNKLYAAKELKNKYLVT
jgi:hypothetical protein